ncbi:glycosyltransferase family 2 protein [Marispirochaeta sp.]|uniref:glycosyltransferase family 2 protein n=1 Tax=Marispirochaeta sp. TaxID=2038653 RepID=UPI0029C723AB|nr:glycosyltransferase family 2 protein [Marispirochaeta sp.]
MIDVSIIIVSYNTARLTCDAVASVYHRTRNISFEIIVVDNNSDDESVALLQQNFPSLRIICLETNIGFAAANNLAAETARGRYFLLLNPDTIVLSSSIDKIVSFADENPRYGIYGGSTFYGDMSRNPTAGWNMSTPWSLLCSASGLSSLFRDSRRFNPESLSWWNWNKPMEVDIVTGCFLLIPSELWHRLGGFDTRFYMYGEDADLCLRSAAINRFCIIVPDAEIIHFGGASESIRADKLIRLLRAKTQLFRKHWGNVGSTYAVIMLKIWSLSRTIVFRILTLFDKKHEGSFRSWQKVWISRREWSRKAEHVGVLSE